MTKRPKPPSPKPAPRSAGWTSGRRGHVLSLLVLLLLLITLFHDVMLQGKTFLSPDQLSSRAVVPFLEDASDRGIYPLWNPYIFSGMPSFASLQTLPLVDVVGQVVYGVYRILDAVFPVPEFARNLARYFLFGAFMYLLVVRRTRLALVALFASLAIVFQPQLVAYAVFGHNSKTASAAFIPLILYLFDEVLAERRIRDVGLLSLAIGGQLLAAHTQMAYYTWLLLGIVGVAWLVHALRSHMPKVAVMRSASAALAALLLGAAISAWLYVSVREYAPHSIRGGTGLDYGYATNWSFSPVEVLTFFVPSFVGFSGTTYWGQMPWTDYPLYMGVTLLFLAAVAVATRRDRFTVSLVIVALFALFVSFGKTLPLLYDLLFRFLPFFNKFRVPSMIHVLVQVSVIILAALGMATLFDREDEARRRRARRAVWILAGLSAAIAFVVLLGRGAYEGWAAGSEKRLTPALAAEAYRMSARDSLWLLVVAGVTTAALLAALRGRLKPVVAASILTAVTIVDLWTVDARILDPKEPADQEAYFAATDAVRFLKADTDTPYRIFPAYDDKPANWYMYHRIENVVGYHAAKIRRYQDFLATTQLDGRTSVGLPPFLSKYVTVTERDGRAALAPRPSSDVPITERSRDDAILDMLNVRYVLSYVPIQDPGYALVQEGQPLVYRNTDDPGRAYFADDIEVADDDAFYAALLSGTFDPRTKAFLAEPPPGPVQADTTRTVSVTAHDIHDLTLTATTAKPGLLVVSEVYYPAGWKAYVDGEETPILRANAILRAVYVTPGRHEIRFEFRPSGFRTGLTITIVSTILALALVAFGVIRRRRQPSAPASA